jgi:hypothetical protein
LYTGTGTGNFVAFKHTPNPKFFLTFYSKNLRYSFSKLIKKRNNGLYLKGQSHEKVFKIIPSNDRLGPNKVRNTDGIWNKNQPDGW